MKKSMWLCFVLLFSISLYAQEKKEISVSEKVKVELTKIYPMAKDVKWSKNSEITRASFMEDGKHISVIFRADTLYMNMIETEISALPEPVKNHLAKYYKKYSIIRAGKIYSSAARDDKKALFGADIQDGSITKRVICYPNGSEMSVSNIPDGKKD
jgi:hypothetical protein